MTVSERCQSIIGRLDNAGSAGLAATWLCDDLYESRLQADVNVHTRKQPFQTSNLTL